MVIPFKATPTAPKDQAWDGGAEVKAASVDDLKVMCAWYDAENPDVKGSYKLPHHESSGDHAVVWRGVANAMARLNQTQMPDSDKKAVYNHLAKHYAQFDETPPDSKDFFPDEEEDEDMKFLEATIEKDEKGGLIAIASTNALDRMDESIDNNGWDLKNYKKNPVILWAHDHSEPAIGTSERTWVQGKGNDAKLMIKPVLHDVTPKAAAIKKLVEMGVIKTLSVGFKNLESDGNILSKNELLENSFCNVPANAEAQMLAYKALKKDGVKEDVMLDLGISAKVLDRLSKLEKDVEDLTSLVKTKIPVAPKAKVLNKRQMLSKAISRASDILLADKHDTLSTDHKRKLVKVIKVASDKINSSQREQING